MGLFISEGGREGERGREREAESERQRGRESEREGERGRKEQGDDHCRLVMLMRAAAWGQISKTSVS